MKIKMISVLLVVVFALTGLIACRTEEKSLSIQELLDLGEKYLLELDYEQALVQFLAVIEIEPMNPRGYTGAAEAYTGLEQPDDAIAILQQGLLALPNDPSIQAVLERILGESITQSGQDNLIGESNEQEDRIIFYASKNSNERGNTSGNINNGGIAAIQEDWIYYSNLNDGGKIYRIRTDGSDKDKLCDKINCYNINVIGDWIYFSSGIVYKMRTDGTECSEVINAYCRNVTVIGDFIYYENNDEWGSLYKIRTDGTEEMELVNFYDIKDFCADGDWIYYNTGQSLNKIRNDGSETIKLSNATPTTITVVDDWVYYIASGLWNINKIRTDGTEKTEVTEKYKNIVYYTIDGDWIYYMDSIEDSNYNSAVGNLYKVRTDGSEITKLSDDYCHFPTVVGDWIYYTSAKDNGNLYRIRTDGTDSQIVD